MPSIRPRHVQQTLSHLQRAQALETAPFTYDLPTNRIALHPQNPRHDSKLLVVPRLLSHNSTSATTGPMAKCASHLRALKFRDLPSLLPSNSLLVRNATRVIPARVPAFKSTGGRAEILLLHPLSSSCSTIKTTSTPLSSSSTTTTTTTTTISTEGQQPWRVILGGRNIRDGEVLTAKSTSTSFELQARVLRRERMYADVLLSTFPRHLPFRTVLEKLGLPPLPPYIRRPAVDNDRDAFQTTFAKYDGSAAAPTAGLHVTPMVSDALVERGVRTVDVVLHIGTATFRQVSSHVAGGHDMHHESVSVPGTVVQKLADQKAQKQPIIAMGTTSVRTIESLYWFGVRLLTDETRTADLLSVEQWEPYETMDRLNGDLPSSLDALTAVLHWCGGPNGAVHGGTNLLIVPDYPFMITDALITNFHQPRSTLLMLVSAFYGGSPKDLASVYRYALENDFRFLSYGDSSIYADAHFFQT